MAQYNLPGVVTSYKERKPVVVASPINTTDEILFFGTATDGPLFTPVNVERPSDAIATFGTYTVPTIGSAMLVPAATESYYSGARNLTLVRITGLDASAELHATAGNALMATLYGKYPGAKYNNVNYEITATEFRVWSAAESVANVTDPTYTYSLTTYDTFDKLAVAINRDTPFSDLRMVVATGSGSSNPTAVGTVSKTNLNGGDDQLSPVVGDYDAGTGLRGALKKAYDLFYEYDADLVIPLGVYVGMNDDATPTYDKVDATKLAEFCFEASLRNNDIIGVIGVKPLADTSLAGMSAMTAALAAVDNTYVNSEGVDIGRYINIVVGEPIYNDNLIGGYANLAPAAYFGLASKLPVQSGTTNKVIKNAVNLRYNLSPSQTAALQNNKFTILRFKPGRGVTVIEGLLASLPTSDFNALSTVRIIHALMDTIRTETDAFIGEPLDMPHIQAIESAIRGVIKTFAEKGALTNGTFQLAMAKDGGTIGNIDVELDLEIPSELRRILVTVSRRFPTYSTTTQA